MRATTFRVTFTILTFFAVAQWSAIARADLLTGTVGEIGMGIGGAGYVIRFKLTDLNQTRNCNSNVGGAGYAWFDQTNSLYRELYTGLLVSKKGAAITCTITNAPACNVQFCTLP